MKKVKEIKELLYKIQRSYASERAALIAAMQEKIWNDPVIEDEPMQQFLSDLAFDLNFYEPNAKDRDEGLGYYGDPRFMGIIHNAIEKVELHLPADS